MCKSGLRPRRRCHGTMHCAPSAPDGGAVANLLQVEPTFTDTGKVVSSRPVINYLVWHSNPGQRRANENGCRAERHIIHRSRGVSSATFATPGTSQQVNARDKPTVPQCQWGCHDCVSQLIQSSAALIIAQKNVIMYTYIYDYACNYVCTCIYI